MSTASAAPWSSLDPNAAGGAIPGADIESRARTLPFASFTLARGALVLAALALLLTRPLSPWWLSADCDANYVASAVNLLLGQPTEKLDHPGLPLQALLAASLALDHAFRSITSGLTLEAYCDALLQDMTPILWIVRAWAILFFLGAMLTTFEVGRRMFSSIRAGVAGAVLFAACPGSLSHATTFRPEAPLDVLNLLSVMLLAQSARRRSPGYLLLACLLLGAAVTVKVHSIALLPLVGLSLAWWCGSKAPCGWEELRAFMPSCRLRALVGPAAVYLALVLWMNAHRPAHGIDARILGGVLAVVLWFGVTAVILRFGVTAAPHAHRRTGRLAAFVLHPLIPAALLAGLAGAFFANAFFVDELTPMARSLWWTISGAENRGSLSLAALAGSFWRQWSQTPLLACAPTLALIAAGIWTGRRERPIETIGFTGAFLLMFGLAVLRGSVHPSPHHYGPALVVAIPLAVGALQRLGVPKEPPQLAAALPRFRFRSVMPTALLVAICAWPVVACERGARGQADRCRAIDELTALCEATRRPGEVVLCDYWAQNADAAHFMQIRDYALYCPDRAYAALPDTPPGLRYAAQRGLRPAFYLTSGTVRTRVATDAQGRSIARGAWGTTFVVERMGERSLDGLTLSAYRILGEPPPGSAGVIEARRD
ncbi:MAG: glycosyltransferase family 39 protein [Phycisphaerales bacterium]|nr:glycosyltransferase family 39 protein [Phycisphaerales bacterium]